MYEEKAKHRKRYFCKSSEKIVSLTSLLKKTLNQRLIVQMLARCGSAGGPIPVQGYRDVLAGHGLQLDDKETARVNR